MEIIFKSAIIFNICKFLTQKMCKTNNLFLLSIGQIL